MEGRLSAISTIALILITSITKNIVIPFKDVGSDLLFGGEFRYNV